MFCLKCGTQLPDNADFCLNCGAKLTDAKAAITQPSAPAAQVQQAAPAPVVQAAPAPVPQPVPAVQPAPVSAAKKKGSKKPLIITLIFLIVAAIVVGAIFIIPMLSESSSTLSTHDELSALRKGMYVYNGTLLNNEYDSRLTSISHLALSGNCYVAYSGDVITDGKLLKIDNFGDINGAGCFSVAASGSAVAYYTSDLGIELLDCTTGKVTVIEEGGDYAGVVISPDGKYVLYGNGHYHNRDSFDLNIYTNGTKTKLNIPSDALSASVVAIDNDGCAYVHVYDSSHESTMAADLYCFDGNGNVINIINNVAMRFFANADNTQIGFYTDRDGMESFSVYDAKTNAVTKINTEGTYDYIGSMPMPLCEYSANTLLYRDAASVRIDMLPAVNYNTHDLLSCYYGPNFRIGSGGACEIKNGSLVPITDANLIRNLSDGSLVYCAFRTASDEYGKLTHYKDGKKEIIAENVVGFGISKDEKTIYYYTETNELWTYKNGSNKKLADNVCTENYSDGLNRLGYETPCIVGNDIFVYRDNNGVCYIYNNGNIKTADNIANFLFSGADVGYYQYLANRSVRTMVSTQIGKAFVTTNYLPFTDANGNECIMYADGSTKVIG